MAAAKGRQQDDIDVRMHLAWQTAQFARMAMEGKLPSLKSVLERVRTVDAKQPIQTKAETATNIRMLAAYYGLPVRRIES